MPERPLVTTRGIADQLNIDTSAIRPWAHFASDNFFLQNAGAGNLSFGDNVFVLEGLPKDMTRRKLYWSIVCSGSIAAFNVNAEIRGYLNNSLIFSIPHKFQIGDDDIRLDAYPSPIYSANSAGGQVAASCVEDESLFCQIPNTGGLYQVALPLRMECSIDRFGAYIRSARVGPVAVIGIFLAVYSELPIGRLGKIAL